MDPRDQRSSYDTQHLANHPASLRGDQSWLQNRSPHQISSIQLPSIASFTSEVSDDERDRRDPLQLPRLGHYSSSEHRGNVNRESINTSSSSHHSGPGLSIHSGSRSDAFMSSLLRAAKPIEEERRYRQSPMSVQSMLDAPSSSSSLTTKAYPASKTTKRRHLDGVEQDQPSSSSSSLMDKVAAEPLNDEIHRKIAQANPAAVLAEIQSCTFQPKPLSMSTAPRRRSFIPPSLLVEEDDTNSSTEYNRKEPHQNQLRASTYTRPWSSFDSHLRSPKRVQRQSDNIKENSLVQQSTPGNTRGDLIKAEVEHVFAPQYQSNVRFQSQSHLLPLHKQQIWSSLMPVEKKLSIRQSILSAQKALLGDYQPAPSSSSSNITTIQCMYANIAQKSYGSEKRFLCPPPCVKISGASRNCQWAAAKVVPVASSAPTETHASSSNQSMIAGSGGGSEEEVMMDATTKEVRFGKLHVGTMSDSRDKTFRLQINLHQDAFANSPRVAGRLGSSLSNPLDTISIPPIPWCTFYTSAITIISKPARKSIRSRSATPAIANGSIICLYNRLNSQTVRTKYLTVNETHLVARQEGWQGFSIELLAKPMAGMRQRAPLSKSAMPSIDNGITYGSIICLRDLIMNTFSDPMMVCKVDKGKVDVSGLIETDPRRVRFQVASDEAWMRLRLLGGETRSSTHRSEGSKFIESRGQSSHIAERWNESNPASPSENANKIAGGSVGGAVVQMQKVTLMSISPLLSNQEGGTEGILECNLEIPRRYLCSTAFEGGSNQDSRPAFFHRTDTLRSTKESQDQEYQERWPLDGAGINVSSPVRFMRPPTTANPIRSEVGSSLVDHVEDPFCWTVVTISESSISCIEANSASTTLPIMDAPKIIKITSFDQVGSILWTTIENLMYTTPNQYSGSSRDWHGKQQWHEIWIGPHGPLRCDVLKSDHSRTDVSLYIPLADQLVSIHQEIQNPGVITSPFTNLIQLPILLIRPEDGISFVSDYVVQLRRSPSLGQSSSTTPYEITTQVWSVTIAPRSSHL